LERRVPEKDKPFYLALIASGFFAFLLIVGSLGAMQGNDRVIEFVKWAAAPVLSFLSSAWALYFERKR